MDLQSQYLAMVGSTIDGKYRLDALVGHGSSGAVYRATNIWAGRECAVKVFQYDGEHRELALQRFVREAQVCNRVRREGRVHPHVVDCLDVGRDGSTGVFFTVQEFLTGQTLDAHLQSLPGRRLAVGPAVSLLLPVIDAIACAHEAGVVHRDLKPENIFLVNLGDGVTPKVLDFGIAQLSDARLTRARDILGTPSYMAPESFMDASRVDARADIWALGVILYECVSGKTPFGQGAPTLLAVMTEIATREPPSLEAAGLMHGPMWQVVRRCLQKDQEQRYANARSLKDALDQLFFSI
ncbi:MAG: serine/threonine protein kinase [Myxococcales bacterium]|nr:serine/threonine protein kinase [Myxococcales bacterium]